MPEPQWNELLESAVHTVLETMFFAEPLATDAGGDLQAPLLASRLSFREENAQRSLGEFGLCVSRDAARQLATRFLAEDDSELADHQVEEVVREMTNMFCGAVVSRLENARKFLLSAPECVPEEIVLGMRGVARQGFALEAGSLMVVLDVTIDGAPLNDIPPNGVAME